RAVARRTRNAGVAATKANRPATPATTVAWAVRPPRAAANARTPPARATSPGWCTGAATWSRRRFHDLGDGMADADAIGFPGDHQPRLFDALVQHRRVVHLAVAIGHAGEVQGRLLQAECGILEALPVPIGLHDVQ